MLKLGKSWRGMKQCPHSKSQSCSQTSQLIHSVLTTRLFFRLCNSKFYTQSAVYSCGASRQSPSCFSIISKIFKNLGYTSQFQKKHTPCNLIFFFSHCKTGTLPALMVHPKTHPPPGRVSGTSIEFHGLVHCPSCFPACQACYMSPRTARKLSSKGKGKSMLQRKDRSPLTLPLLGCTRLVLGVPAQPQSPSSPPWLSAKEAGVTAAAVIY